MGIPRMIHFFGPDGSGKTTQVEILVKLLQKEDQKVRKCWLRSPHTFAFLLWRFFIKIGFYRTAYNAFGYGIKLPLVNRDRVLRNFWAITELISVLPLIMRIRLMLSQGYKFVAERFILDTVTTIAYFIDDITFLKGKVARILFFLVPSDTFFIFLDSDFDTIFARRAPKYGAINSSQAKGYGAIPEAAVEPREFIDFQRLAYKLLSKSFSALQLNTSEQSIQETTASIMKHMYSY